MSNRANTSVLIIIHSQPHTHINARTRIGIPLLTFFIEGQTVEDSNFISEVRVFILKWKFKGQAFKKTNDFWKVGQDIYNIVKDEVSRGSPLFTSELDI